MNTLHLLFAFLLISGHGGTVPANSPDSGNFSPIRTEHFLSTQQVTCLDIDKDGNLWIGTEQGLNRYNGDGYTHYLNTTVGESEQAFNYVRDVFCGSDGTIWVTSTQGVSRKGPGDERFRLYPISATRNIPHDIFEGRDGTIYIDTGYDLYRYENSGDSLSVVIRKTEGHAFPAPNGTIWLTGPSSIRCYDGKTFNPMMEYPLPYKGVSGSFMDKAGNLWLIMDKGIGLFSTSQGKFLPVPDRLGRLSGESVMDIFQYGPSSVIFSTSSGNLYHYDQLSGGVSERFDTSFPFDPPFKNRRITSLLYDGSSLVFTGSEKGGFQIVKEKRSKGNPLLWTMYDDSIISVIKAADGDLLLLSEDNLLMRLDPKSLGIKMISLDQLNAEVPFILDNNSIWSVMSDDSGHLWLSIGEHIFKCSLGESSLAVLEHHSIPGIKENISFINNHGEKPDVWTWGVLYKYIDGKYVPTDERPGYMSSGTAAETPREEYLTVSTAGEVDGNTWRASRFLISESGGKGDNATEKHFVISSPMKDLQFKNYVAGKTDGGLIYYGTNHGFMLMDPSMPMSSADSLRIDFERLTLNDGTSVNIKDLSEVTLDHAHRSVSVSFTDHCLFGISSVTFSHKMEGVDSDWINLRPDDEKTLSYANIPFGKHTLSIRATDNEGRMSPKSKDIVFVIRRPWYGTAAANILYLLAFLSIAYLIVSLYRKIRAEQIRSAVAENEKAQQKKLYESNLDSFASVAHEFKTPLTMISGAIASLTSHQPTLSESNRLHSIIQRNSGRMLKLVNQLMDFSQMRSNMIRLSLEYASPSVILKEVSDSFNFAAMQKNLSMKSDIRESETVLPLDKDKFEKIVYNLLSNAVKYSLPGGEISLEMKSLQGKDASSIWKDANPSFPYIMVRVTDNGIGIPKDEKEKIFDRYYRIESKDREDIGGSGIGLYMSRNLARIHHGFLTASDREDGKKGSVFTLLIPSSDKAYTKEEFKSSEDREELTDSRKFTEEVLSSPIQAFNPEMKKVMVVDDDYEMLFYLKSILSNEYNVSTFFNATTALDAIAKENPDLIVSDVLMLEMDGFEFCQRVKKDIGTCHIPVILLTAKDAMKDQIKGLELGANAYITKPFDPAYLMASIRSQLSFSQKIKEVLSKSTVSTEIGEDMMGKKDRAFMKSFLEILEEDLSNPDLNITFIADRLGISRTNLYYKIKSLTGETPTNYFKKYKLNRSLEMLKEGKYKISAVAQMVGLTPSYFAKLFQEEFGILPSQYAPPE